MPAAKPVAKIEAETYAGNDSAADGRFRLSTDILLTFAAAISGERMGHVHAQVVLRHFGDVNDPPERRQYMECVVQKLFRTLADNRECRSLYLSAQKQAKSPSIIDWPQSILADFLFKLQGLLDLTELFDDVPIFAYQSEISKSSRNSRRITKHRGSKAWYLQLTLSGNAHAHTEQGTTEHGPGDLVLIPPDTPFFFDRATHSTHWRYVCVYFRPRAHALPWLNWETVLNGAMRAHVGPDEQVTLERGFIELIRLSGDASQLGHELQHNMLEQILLRSRMSSSREMVEEDSRIAQAKRFIAQHYFEPLTVVDISRAVGLSASRLSALFKARAGLSLLEWRDKERMQAACQLLRDTDLSVAQIAQKVGYADPLYFSRMFKRRMSVSPTSLRGNVGALRH